jgi:hypothetical protein
VGDALFEDLPFARWLARERKDIYTAVEHLLGGEVSPHSVSD